MSVSPEIGIGPEPDFRPYEQSSSAGQPNIQPAAAVAHERPAGYGPSEHKTKNNLCVSPGQNFTQICHNINLTILQYFNRDL